MSNTHQDSDRHSHDSMKNLPLQRLWIVLIFTTTFMFVETIAGYISGSLALLADAGHMLNDVFSISLAIVGIYIARQKSTAKQTFGFKRVEVFSALLNGISLLAISYFIIQEAIKRLHSLETLEIIGPVVMTIAVVGLIINLVAMKLLASASEQSINVAGAYHHVIADMLGSVAALIAGVGIYLWNATWLDLAASSVVAAMVANSGFTITKKALSILLESAPEDKEVDKLLDELKKIEGVVAVHDFHAWRVTDGLDILTAHICVGRNVNQDQVLQKSLEIAKDHGFEHSTFQLELEECNGSYDDCVPQTN